MRSWVALAVLVGTVWVPAAQPAAAAPAAAGGFQAVAPSRLLDTRPGEPTVDGQQAGLGAIGPGATLRLPVAGRGGLPAAVGTIVVNVTAPLATASTYLSLTPDGASTSSNLNPGPGVITTNTTHVPVAADGTIAIFNLAGFTHVIVDLLGWYPSTTSCVTAISPIRLLDTRPGEPTADGAYAGGGALGPDRTITVPIAGRGGLPADRIGAVAVNVTAVDASQPTYVTAFPTGVTLPTASNLNPRPGPPSSNATQVRLGADGALQLYNRAGSTHLVVDVLAWYPTAAEGCFQPLSPARLADTRAGEPTVDGLHRGEGARSPRQTLTVKVTGRGGVPRTGVAAVAVNVTATLGTAPTYVTVYPDTLPTASNLNPPPGVTTTNSTQVPVSADGTITLFNLDGRLDLIVDVLGWYPSGDAGQHPRIYLPGAAARLAGMLDAGTPAAARFRSYADARLATPFASLWDSNFFMWYFALLGNLTGDDRYCARAVAGIEWWVASEEARIAGYVPGSPATRPVVAYDSYLDVGPIVGDVMTVYDWCHASLTAAQRQRWAAYAHQAIWNVWHPDDAVWGGRPAPWSGWSIDNPSNNYYYSFLRATMLFGLAAEGEHPAAAGWKQFFRVDKIANQLVPTFERDLAGGGSREGTGYGTAMMRLWEIYDVWEQSTGEDLGALTSHTRASLDLFFHTVAPTLDRISPNGDHSRDSSAELFDYHRHYAQSLAHVVGDPALAGRVRSLFAASSVPRMQNGFMIVYDFLYDLSPFAPQPLSQLNTAYRAAGAGQVWARTDWTSEATWLNLTAGPYTESHAHRDQGSFVLYRNRWMALDPNVYSHSGIRLEEQLHNLVRVVRSDGATVTQRFGTSSTVQAVQQGPGWLHVAADTTPVYAGTPVQRMQREWLFVDPGVLVVFDRVTSDPGTQQVWQLTTPVAGTTAGSTTTFTDAGTTMRLDRVITPVVAVSSLDWTSDPDLSAGFRLDATASAGANTFLHVLSFGSDVSSVARSDAGGRQGVTIVLGDGRTVTARFSPTSVDGTLSISSGQPAALTATVNALALLASAS